MIGCHLRITFDGLHMTRQRIVEISLFLQKVPKIGMGRSVSRSRRNREPISQLGPDLVPKSDQTVPLVQQGIGVAGVK